MALSDMEQKYGSNFKRQLVQALIDRGLCRTTSDTIDVYGQSNYITTCSNGTG